MALASSILAFPSFDDFAHTAKAFIEKYSSNSKVVNGKVDEEQIGAGRTNQGWEWREAKHKVSTPLHASCWIRADGKWTKGHGYLYRRVTRYVKMNRQSTKPADAEQLVDSSDDEDDEDGLEEEEQDESSRLISRKKKQNPSDKGSSAKDGTDRNEREEIEEQDEETGEVVKISVEHHIIHSKTYHCPQLLLRAWDGGKFLSTCFISHIPPVLFSPSFPTSTLPAFPVTPPWLSG